MFGIDLISILLPLVTAAVFWSPTARCWFHAQDPVFHWMLAHALSLTFFIACCFGMGLLGIYTPHFAQILYFSLSICCWYVTSDFRQKGIGRPLVLPNVKTILWWTPVVITALWVRLADPARYISFASVDYAVFAENLRHHWLNHEVFTKYPSPYSLVLNGFQFGLDRWRILPLVNQILSLGALGSIFAWTRAAASRQVAMLHTAIWAGAFFLIPVLSKSLLYPQFTLVMTLFPLLLLVETTDTGSSIQSGAKNIRIMLNLLLSMCATYFAILISALFLLSNGFRWLKHPAAGRIHLLRGLPYLMPIAFIGCYYLMFLPAFSETGLGFVTQSEKMLMYVNESNDVEIPVQDIDFWEYPVLDTLPAPLSTLGYFLLPVRLDVIRDTALENIFFMASLLAWIWTLWEVYRTRSPSKTLYAFLIGILLISSFTGILEIPGYQGRATYLLAPVTLLILIQSGYAWALKIPDHIPWKHEGYLWLRKPFSTRVLFLLCSGMIFLCYIPSWRSPPVAGETIQPQMPFIRVLPDHELLAGWMLSREPLPRETLLVVGKGPAEDPDAFKSHIPFGFHKVLQNTSVQFWYDPPRQTHSGDSTGDLQMYTLTHHDTTPASLRDGYWKKSDFPQHSDNEALPFILLQQVTSTGSAL